MSVIRGSAHSYLHMVGYLRERIEQMYLKNKQFRALVLDQDQCFKVK